MSVDPQFCDYAHDNVTLASSSPLLNPAGCNLIGALGSGCVGAVVGVLPQSKPEPMGLSILPLPSSEYMRFSWAPESLQVRLEVFDVAGAVRWSSRPSPGVTNFSWDGRGSNGSPLAPGAYYARKIVGDRQSSARIVIVK